MIKKRGSIEYITSPLLESDRMAVHSFLTRKGGRSTAPFVSLNFSFREGDSPENISFHKKIVGEAFGFSPDSLITLNQVHGKEVIVLDKPKAKGFTNLEGDAMVTNVSGLALGILTADCLPILIMEQSKGVVGAVHSGWRGTVMGVLQEAILTMERVFKIDRAHVKVAIGPSIGPCCYEVDEKLLEPMKRAFPKGLKSVQNRKLDLAEINYELLLNMGIKKDSIHIIRLCTSCRQDLFFSYRRDGKTGRQLSFIKVDGGFQQRP